MPRKQNVVFENAARTSLIKVRFCSRYHSTVCQSPIKPTKVNDSDIDMNTDFEIDGEW